MKRLSKISTFMKCKALFIVALLMTSWVSLISQDTTMVSGVIRSGSGQPISGVSVSIEGSSMLPVVTSDSGTFEIQSFTGDEWLIISAVSGYKMRRIYLNKRQDLVLRLTSEDLESGDDQVVLLAGQVPRRDIVSSFSELNTSGLHHTYGLSIDQHMEGQIPGMYVVNRSGMPGTGAVTTIRGVSSIYANNQPIYVVDGFPQISHGLFGSNISGQAYNGLMGVNPFDVSKTTILKDPSVGSVFGSKGSNGIILVETLDPSATQTSIELNLRMGYSLAPSNQTPQLDGGQHKTLMNEVLFSSGMHEEDIREFYPNLFLTEDDARYIDYQHNTNWQDYVFDNAMLYNLNVKVKGGDEIARYGLSFGYLSSDGIIKNTGYSGYNLRFVSRLNIFTWLKMDAGVSLNYNNSTLKDAAVTKETSPIRTSLAKSPLLNPYQYDIDGRELSTLAEVDEIGVSNPLATIENYEALNNNYSFTAFMGLEGTISGELSVISKFSFTYDVLKEQIFQPNRGMELYYNQEAFNVSKAMNNDLTSMYNNTYLRYDKRIGNNHRITSHTGFYMLTNEFQMDWGLTKNAHENDQYRMLQDGQNNLREIGGDNRNWNWISFYEYLNYSYRDRYLLTASIALDGSSRVGKDAINTVDIGGSPFGLFYSGGLAWRLSSESFLKNQAWLDELKLKFTAGKSGNDDIGESTATNYYQAVKFRETVGLYPAILTNDQLSYETVTMLSGGINLAILGNRFTASVEYFVSTTNDMIINTPVEAYYGYDYLIENGGSIENKGWELGTFMRLVNAQSFKWDVSAYFSTVSNVVTSIKGDRLVYQVPGAERVNQVGSPANSFYGYIYNGVFTTQEAANNANLYNDRGIRYNAGDAFFTDLSGPDGSPDGIINGYDKTEIGNPQPDYHGSFNNSFSYKGWTLSASLHFVFGHEVFNYVRYQNERMTDLDNQSSHVLNRWQYDGHETSVPRAVWEDPVGNSDFSTRWIEDGSFMRVKYVKVSYTTPGKFLMFKNAEFYASVNNVFTATNYLGYDPEFAYSYSQLYSGIDYGMAPLPRQFIVGINIGL